MKVLRSLQTSVTLASPDGVISKKPRFSMQTDMTKLIVVFVILRTRLKMDTTYSYSYTTYSGTKLLQGSATTDD